MKKIFILSVFWGFALFFNVVQVNAIERVQNLETVVLPNGIVKLSWDKMDWDELGYYYIFKDIDWSLPLGKALFYSPFHYVVPGEEYAHINREYISVPDDITECYDFDAIPGRTHDYWVVPMAENEETLRIELASSKINRLKIPEKFDIGDAIISDIKIIPESPRANEDIGFIVTVKNIGEHEISFLPDLAALFKLTISYGDGDRDSINYKIPDDGKLSPDEEIKIKFSHYYKSENTFAINACINCDYPIWSDGKILVEESDLFRETDISNNTYSKVITVSKDNDKTPPASPSDVVLIVTDMPFFEKILKHVYISWVRPSDSDFDRVNIYRSESEGDLGKLVYSGSGTKETENGRYFTRDTKDNDESLDPNIDYYYTIRSVDRSGNESTNTNQFKINTGDLIEITDKTPPPLPNDIKYFSRTMYNGANAYHYISWDVPEDLDLHSIRLYRSEKEGELGEAVSLKYYYIDAPMYDQNVVKKDFYYSFAFNGWGSESNMVFQSGSEYYYTLEASDIYGNSVKGEQFKIKTASYSVPEDDEDGDGITNTEEERLGTDPTKIDTTGNGIPDRYELEKGLSFQENDSEIVNPKTGEKNIVEFAAYLEAGALGIDKDTSLGGETINSESTAYKSFGILSMLFNNLIYIIIAFSIVLILIVVIIFIVIKKRELDTRFLESDDKIDPKQ